MSEIVALFPNRTEAERAIDHMDGLGYDVDDLGYMDRYRDDSGQIVTDESHFEDGYDHHGDAGEEAATGAAGGAVGGAAVGAGAALLASAGMLLVPGIGPFLAAGTIAGTLGATAAGAAGGAVVGGAAGAIFGSATDDDYADDETTKHYREGVASGDALVTAHVDEDEAGEIADTLRTMGATRVDIYGDEGWIDY